MVAVCGNSAGNSLCRPDVSIRETDLAGDSDRAGSGRDYAFIQPSDGGKTGRRGWADGYLCRAVLAMGKLYGGSAGGLLSDVLGGAFADTVWKRAQEYAASFCTVFARWNCDCVDNSEFFGGCMCINGRLHRKRKGMDRKISENGRSGLYYRSAETAYMTLEACLIVPLAVILIACLMILAFYLYTVSFLNQAAYLSAFRASLEDTGRADIARQEVEALLEEGLIPFQNLEKEVSASLTVVTVRIEAEFTVPGAGILPVWDGKWKIEAKKKAQIRDAVAFIRALRRISS